MAQNSNTAAVHLVEEDAEIQAKGPGAQPENTEQVALDAPKVKRKGGRRRVVLSAILLAALAGGSYLGYQWWTNGRFMVSTDDAYIGGDIAYISPKVTGYVSKLNVKANQSVKKGDALVTLDNGDYQIALEQAQAQLATQQLSLKSIDAQKAVAVAALGQANAKKRADEAVLHGAELAQTRASKLQKQNFASNSSLDNANVALDQAKAALAADDAAIQSANANIAAIGAQYAQAESTLKSLQLAVDKAKRDLSFTVLRAPYDGVTGNFSVQEGDLVSPGVRLMAVVPSDELYIDANFKETQIAEIQPGQVAHIHIDALGDKDIEGKVVSLSPASGSVFSLLPAENATGNFTKITQRLPVRISIPKEALATHRLMAGLSVVVDVDSRTTPDSVKQASAE